MKLSGSILIILFLVSLSGTQAQFFSRKTNRFDENGLKTGRWVSYWDDDHKVPMSKARYNNGRECGTSKEYHQNGIIRLKMRFQKKKIRIKYYRENRKLEQKGWARIEYNESDIHFFWHGTWKFFNADRKLIEIAEYLNGEEKSRRTIY
ncbi:MAG: hypothetical protein KDC05_10455 [Bacteroidales bacterium]|nr:hypothetical protein [Bacteroidales bacterium]